MSAASAIARSCRCASVIVLSDDCASVIVLSEDCPRLERLHGRDLVRSAKARGTLPRPWAKGKRVIVAGDADKPGQDGQRQAAAAYVQAGAAEVLLAKLPYPDREGPRERYYGTG